jgi:hypothetical protein
MGTLLIVSGTPAKLLTGPAIQSQIAIKLSKPRKLSTRYDL